MVLLSKVVPPLCCIVYYLSAVFFCYQKVSEVFFVKYATNQCLSRVESWTWMVCVCVYILPPWRFLPSARCPRHTWGHRSTILCCEYQLTALCQVPSLPYLKMSYFTSKDENSSRSITGEKTIWYNTKRWYLLIWEINRPAPSRQATKRY